MCIHCGTSWGDFDGVCDRGSASNQVLVKEVVERINKLNNNEFSGLDGACREALEEPEGKELNH